jgi:hypothetical protein
VRRCEEGRGQAWRRRERARVRARRESEQEKAKVACSVVGMGRRVVEQRVSSRAGGCQGGDGYGYGSRWDAQQAVGASAGLCVGDLSQPEIRGLHRGSRSAGSYLFPFHVHEPSAGRRRQTFISQFTSFCRHASDGECALPRSATLGHALPRHA